MFSPEQRQLLLDLAEKTIRQGCIGAEFSAVESQLTEPVYPSRLCERQACFVSLHKNGQLRGCIGSLEPCRSLITDVIHNAWAAAFYDPRFAALRTQEIPGLTLEISVLSMPQKLGIQTEQQLFAALSPNIDGLIIDDQAGHRATFLPQVWEQLPEPQQFLAHLKQKAGLNINSWPASMICHVYQCEAFEKQL